MTSDGWWTESVNFLLFRSELDIEQIAAEVERAFDPAIDLALLGKSGSEDARAIGAIEDARLFELIPGARRFRTPPERPSAPIMPAA